MSSPDTSEYEAPSMTTLTNVRLDVGNESTQKDFSPAKYYKQTYRKDWELMPDFKGWLSSVPGEPTRAYCKFCEKTLHAHRLSLLKHTCTLKHTRAARNNHSNKQSDSLVKRRLDFAPIDSEEQDNSDPPKPVFIGFKEEVVASTPDELTVNPSIDAEESDPDDPMDVPLSGSTKDNSKTTGVPLTTAPAQRLGGKVIITEVPQSQSSTVSPDDGYITTHVLDTSKGRPIAGLLVSLYRLVDGRWTLLAESMTNPDGRSSGFVQKQNFVAGRYKLHFDVDRYYEYRRIDFLYPFIEIVFDVRSPQDHYHIPLLLSPYGYTTYRGS